MSSDIARGTADIEGDKAEAEVKKRIVTVVITSDTICPWCFIAKRRFDKAVALLDNSKIEVRVRWKPWFLDALLPSPGRPFLTHMYGKFGEEKSKQMMAAFTEVGETVGIHFKFGGRFGNSLNSHRLSEWSYKFGKQHALMEELFRAHIELQKDISDIGTLVDVATAVGLNKDEAKQFLLTDEFASLVKTQVAESFDKGVSGVPHFVFDGKYALTAVQDDSAFVNMFKRLGLLS